MLDNQQVSFPKNKNQNKNKEKDEEKEVEKAPSPIFFSAKLFLHKGMNISQDLVGEDAIVADLCLCWKGVAL